MSKIMHEKFMLECFRLAEKGKGYVSPNPMVGAVLVRNGRIVARGFHRRFGGPHAEVECIRSYRGNFKGTTLYVNLEPCSHFGKTPPCTDLIIRSGIPTVVVGMKDPNPVAGRGVQLLRRSGVRVLSGILENRARELNRFFVTHVTRGIPFVHVKIAQTLDGKISAADGSQTWISGKDSQRLVHRWRAEHDAVLVGANTIRVDDPALTVRLVRGRHPAAVVLDGNLSIGLDAQVLKTTRSRRVLVFTSVECVERRKTKVRELISKGAAVIPVKSSDSQLNLTSFLKKLYKLGIASILVEGGGSVFSQFLREGRVDLLSIFLAPVFQGSGIAALTAMKGTESNPIRVGQNRISCLPVGRDVLIQYGFY